MSESENTGLCLVKVDLKRREFLTAALAGTAAAVATPKLLKSSPLRVVPQESELAPELVQELLDTLLLIQLSEFAGSLGLARTLWRRHRDLVEAPEFPEHLRAALVAREGEEPDDDCGIYGAPYITEEVVAEQRIEAIRWAAERVAAGRAS
jgi:hypothetical protein